MKRIILGVVALLAVIAIAVLFYVIPVRIDAEGNAVTAHAPYDISPEARALHDTLDVADLHSDMLLWMRNPARRNNRGQTDLPRLREGGAALQVFATVTKSPPALNYEENTADGDDITALAIVQRWPVDSWGSIRNRALYQAGRLRRLDERDDRFTVVRTRGDLEAVLAARAADRNVLGGILATEGAHPLEADLANIDVLWEAGFRMMGLQHFFDNALGGSLHGVSGAGLTPFGRDALVALVERGMIIDVAHSSEAVVRDVLALTDVPLVVSHTGIHGIARSPATSPTISCRPSRRAAG